MEMPKRTLSEREAELVGWLEAERRQSISITDVKNIFNWSDQVARHTVSRLAKKGWLYRTAQGRYEVLLAETGGWIVPNPWAALSTWSQQYYVCLKSAAYEQDLTPDRPRNVQVCVPTGAKSPNAWEDIPIVLIPARKFNSSGVLSRKLHGFQINIASPEKVLAEGARRLNRVGGVLGLSRIIYNGVDKVDWHKVIELANESPHGRAGLRRIAALMEILNLEIPEPLAVQATAKSNESLLYLGDRTSYGHHGKRLSRWQVMINVDPASIREEVVR